MVAQFADVCAQGSYSTMGILFACVPRAKFSSRERRHSSSAVLPDTEIPRMATTFFTCALCALSTFNGSFCIYPTEITETSIEFFLLINGRK